MGFVVPKREEQATLRAGSGWHAAASSAGPAGAADATTLWLQLGQVAERGLLAKPELDVRHAGSPNEALEAMKAALPDLIFPDLEFGNVREAGPNFLKQLKATDEYARIPVVVVSSLGLDRDQIEKRLLEAGAAGYLSRDAANGPESFKAALMSMETGGVYIQGTRPNGTGIRLRTLGLTPRIRVC